MIRLIFLCLFLAACQPKPPIVIDTSGGISESPVSGDELEKPKDKVEIDPYLLKECDRLPEFKIQKPTDVDVLRQKAAESVVYKDCASRHRSLVEIVKKAFNLQ